MRLSDWMAKRKLTAEQAANLFGCSESQVHHMVKKTNPRRPGRKLAARIVEKTRRAVTFEDLFGPDKDAAA
jgi:hypothetical protein